MKFVGLVGSNAEQSYNRKLLEFIRKQFKLKFELEVLEIDDVPLFNQDEKWDESFQLRILYNKITRADGVIIATPEHNHTITAALKSVLEWLSYEVHPFENKPVMIVGASYYDQGTSRAQVHLRKILDAPGVNAYTLPGNEFLLGKAKEAFDNNGNITNEGTVKFLESCLDNFIKYVEVVSKLKKPKPIEPKDLNCGKPIATLLEILPKHHGHDLNGVEPVRKVNQRLRAPRHCAELAELVCRWHIMFHQVEQFKNKTILSVLKKTDAFRRPERFAAALNVCIADTQGRLNREDTPYPQRAHWLALLEAANKVDSGKIAAECRAQKKAHLIAEEIDRAQLAQIAPLQKAYKTKRLGSY